MTASNTPKITPQATRRAIQYMEALAQGIDPISKQPIPGDSVLNQERLAACFQYTAAALQRTLLAQQAAAPSQTSVSRQAAAAQFQVMSAPSEPEDIRALLASAGLPEAFPYTAEAISLYQLQNALRAKMEAAGLKPLPNISVIQDWLLNEGMLEEAEPPLQFRLTSKGQEAGFQKDGPEDAPLNSRTHLCTEQGQRFLVEHLEDILSFWRSGIDALLSVLDMEALRNAPCSKEPVLLSAILEQINSLLPPCTHSDVLTASAISNWLLKHGLLVDRDAGSSRRLPSRQGEAIGITMLARNRTAAAFYHEEAQRFILDHIPDILKDHRSIRASVPPEKKTAQPFHIPPQLPSTFPYSTYPLSTTRFQKLIDDTLCSEGLEPLPPRTLMRWMSSQGFTRYQTMNGTQGMFPTEQGEHIGLTISEWNGVTFTAFPEATQRFIVERLEEIAAFASGQTE